MDNSSLGDRMKWYERRHVQEMMPMIPVMARMDGRAFHTFTKGLERPFDHGMSNLMVETTKFLVGETDARCGYTQSDEITLVWLAEDSDSYIFFNGKLQKMCSVLASMATAFFNRNLPKYLPDKADQMPLFDSRIWQVPMDYEAANNFIWREQDATRNSIQMAARAYYSHNACHNKNTSELQDMLHDKGVNWNNYPNFFKRGTYVRRRDVERPFTAEELEALPEKHAARNDPNLVVKRRVVMREDFLPLTKYVNRTGIILHGEDPVTVDQANDECVTHNGEAGPQFSEEDHTL